jgi:hypothetical protein
MELRILTGNTGETKSARADEDDMLQESMEKYATTSKSGNKILTKENCQEAAVEIVEQKKSLDGLDAMDKIKNQFS